MRQANFYILIFTILLNFQAFPKSKQTDPSAWTGTYTGKFPGKDARRIHYKLTLNQDLTFQEEILINGQSTPPKITKGEYRITTKEILVLIDKKDPYQYFKKTSTGIQLLDNKGKEIYGTHADKYILKRQVLETPQNQVILEKKMLEGIDFYAIGNNPSWTLDIDFEKNMTFKYIDGSSHITQATKSPQTTDVNATRYRAVTENSELLVAITEGQCKDNKTGEMFTSKVQIDAKKTTDKDYQHFEGCGNYIPDYRLNDIWAIQTIYQKEISLEGLTKGVPVIEFHLKENTIMGNTGCNNFNGTANYIGNKIEIGQLLNTLMACPDSNVEEYFLKILNGKTLTYKFDNGELKLYENKVEVMTLKHVD